MDKEFRLKYGLVRVFTAIVLCLGMILLKFVFRQEPVIAAIYNYLVTDIVFP